MWQYTEEGKVNGITTTCDINILENENILIFL